MFLIQFANNFFAYWYFRLYSRIFNLYGRNQQYSGRKLASSWEKKPRTPTCCSKTTFFFSSYGIIQIYPVERISFLLTWGMHWNSACQNFDTISRVQQCFNSKSLEFQSHFQKKIAVQNPIFTHCFPKYICVISVLHQLLPLYSGDSIMVKRHLVEPRGNP